MGLVFLKRVFGLLFLGNLFFSYNIIWAQQDSHGHYHDHLSEGSSIEKFSSNDQKDLENKRNPYNDHVAPQEISSKISRRSQRRFSNRYRSRDRSDAKANEHTSRHTRSSKRPDYNSRYENNRPENFYNLNRHTSQDSPDLKRIPRKYRNKPKKPEKPKLQKSAIELEYERIVREEKDNNCIPAFDQTYGRRSTEKDWFRYQGSGYNTCRRCVVGFVTKDGKPLDYDKLPAEFKQFSGEWAYYVDRIGNCQKNRKNFLDFAEGAMDSCNDDLGPLKVFFASFYGGTAVVTGGSIIAANAARYGEASNLMNVRCGIVAIEPKRSPNKPVTKSRSSENSCRDHYDTLPSYYKNSDFIDYQAWCKSCEHEYGCDDISKYYY